MLVKLAVKYLVPLFPLLVMVVRVLVKLFLPQAVHPVLPLVMFFVQVVNRIIHLVNLMLALAE